MTKRLMSRLATVATLGAATLLLAAPGQALAQDNSSLSVSPHTVRPGATVSITQFCNPKQPDVVVSSELFGKLPMKEETAAGTQSATYHTSVTIPANAKHGSHKLTGSCGTSTTLTVSPTGAVRGGTGMDTDNGALIAAGAGTLAAGAIGGFWLLRRREAGAPAA